MYHLSKQCEFQEDYFVTCCIPRVQTVTRIYKKLGKELIRYIEHIENNRIHVSTF